MATKSKKPKNLIPSKTLKKHYKKDGTWRTEKANPDGYDDIDDYATEHPEHVFQTREEGEVNPKTGEPFKYANKYVAIHDPEFAKALGSASYSHFKSGGLVARVGERKIK